jgi:uncharacterized protein YjbI with pentapeptide repeats
VESERGEIVARTCGRQALEGSDRCIFHDANAWKTHADTVREEIREKINRGDLNFQKYHFPEMDFTLIAKEFREPVDFVGAVFHKDVHFDGMVFSDVVDFRAAEFLGHAFFTNAKFSKYVKCHGARFKRNVWFVKTEFHDGASLGYCSFLATASFTDAVFRSFAVFTCDRFLGEAVFNGAVFEGHAYFRSAKFLRGAAFHRSKFLKLCSFYQAEFSGDETWFDRVAFCGDAEFDLVRFNEIVIYDEVDMNKAKFSFRNTIFQRGLQVDEALWSEKGYRLSIERHDPALAADSHEALRRGFENMGRHRIGGELFYREMICRKNMTSIRDLIDFSGSIVAPLWLKTIVRSTLKESCLDNLLDRGVLLLRIRVNWGCLFHWFWTTLFDISCGFGERPKRVLVGSSLVILLFTILYFPLVVSTCIMDSLRDAFLLSLDAFTPGKFVDIAFITPGEWLVQIETVLGWFMLSLFLLVFTRKMSRG